MKIQLKLDWMKSALGGWCSLMGVDLTGIYENGVYIIWHVGCPGQVVRIGQGHIANRLFEHRSDRSILAYRNRGELYVTWAAVAKHLRGGVERYLAENYPPLVGTRFPDESLIVVNSPWE